MQQIAQGKGSAGQDKSVPGLFVQCCSRQKRTRPVNRMSTICFTVETDEEESDFLPWWCPGSGASSEDRLGSSSAGVPAATYITAITAHTPHNPSISGLHFSGFPLAHLEIEYPNSPRTLAYVAGHTDNKK